MKQIVRYQLLMIPNKLKCELRVSLDDRYPAVYNIASETAATTSVALRPFITLSIIRPNELDENGQRIRAQWDINDNVTMTKYNMPVFLEELKGILTDMKIPELYSYHGDRLELNEEIAQKIRRVFMIGNTTVEFSAQVIVNETDDNRVEGIKIKFNNENYSVLLTLNDMMALVYTLDHLDADSIALIVYTTYVTKSDRPVSPSTPNPMKPTVDILPKNPF